MLEHQMKVISGVSEDRELFRNELLKSLNWLSYDEIKKLKDWAEERFGNEYSDIIHDVLSADVKYA